MANIQVSELLPIGYELFNDDASFLNELGNQEIANFLGGFHSHARSHSNSFSQSNSNSFSQSNSNSFSQSNSNSFSHSQSNFHRHHGRRRWW